MFLAISTHHWYSVGWVDWVTVAALLLTLVGLLLTWRQARKATNAAKAAERANRQTERQIRLRQLMVLVPQLNWILNELDSAIEDADPRLIRRYLGNWRAQATFIHGILSGIKPEDQRIIRCLLKSVSLAGNASAASLSNDTSVQPDYMRARTAIATACDILNSWVGRNSTQGLPDDDA